MASRAIGGDAGMFAVQPESGHTGVVELPRVERTKFAVQAGMLRVAHHAITLHIPMNADPFCHPIRNRLVARETLLHCHLATLLVTLLAIQQSFERGVRSSEFAWRNEIAELRFDTSARCQRRHAHETHGDTRPHTPHSYQRNGTYPRYMVMATCATTMMSIK